MQPAPAPGAAASTAVRPRPEVLAPAGDIDCVRAAVENGADAVYFGIQKWNARARAANFPLEELPDLFAFLHLRGVRGYVTFNTLVFSNELEEAERTLERIIAAGPDALILQDLGIARLVHDLAPGVPLHASTQTTTTAPEQMELLKELGFSRVVMARELSIPELRQVQAATDLELEVFAHGALCVAYSGQCLTSEALGGRSANRGACAQACRLPYDLVVDGQVRDLGDQKYLISPQDLAAYELVPDLMGLVSCLKIEGRLKTPEYVAATTRAYRKAVDQAAATFSRDEVLTLQQVFSRGLSPGFLSGINHQTLVPGLSPKKRGVFLGKVSGVRGTRVTLSLEAPLKPGDGIVYDYGRPQDEEPGGRVSGVWRRGVRVDAADQADTVDLEVWECPAPQVGWKVWKTSDPAMYRALRATFEKTTGTRVPVDAVVDSIGDRLRIALHDGTHRVVGETGPLQIAQKRPLTPDYLRQQLGRMGSTPFELRTLDVTLGQVMVPVSLLNELRRSLCEDLEKVRRTNPGHRLRPGALDRLRQSPARTEGTPQLVALCRSMEQVQAALEERIATIECDFEDIRKYREAVPLARARGAAVYLAPPRIHKPGERGILRNVAGAAPDGILVRSTAHLAFARTEAPKLSLIGDFSLNASNELTSDLYLSKGLSRFVPSYDLNWEQFQALLGRIDPGRAEVVIHHHMPMFHNEHCVFAALLSKGKDATDCGRPCDRHALALKDWAGHEHPVKVDVGCRNTVYNAIPQSASQYVRRMVDLGVCWFRVEFLRESGEEAQQLLGGYRRVLEGRGDGERLWKELRASNVLGVTRGPLGRGDA
ncbi:MAG TPA: U32 family peptidase [Planctomycetota bacterium]|nr:U32 family peptidase [Planctomycetota bacterium]